MSSYIQQQKHVACIFSEPYARYYQGGLGVGKEANNLSLAQLSVPEFTEMCPTQKQNTAELNPPIQNVRLDFSRRGLDQAHLCWQLQPFAYKSLRLHPQQPTFRWRAKWRTLMAEDPEPTTWWRSRYFPSENHVCYQAEVHAWPLFDQSQLTTPVTPAPVQLDRAHIEFSRHFKGVCLDCEVTKTSEHHANELEQMMWGVPSFRYKLKNKHNSQHKRANLGALEVWNKHMAF